MTTKSVEDELFELLNSPDPVISSKSAPTDGPSISSFALTTASFEDSQDFLSWLDDTSPTKIIPQIKLEHASSLKSTDLSLLSSLDELALSVPASNVSDSSAITKVTENAGSSDPNIDTLAINDSSTGVTNTLDSIYDEMFGASVLEKPSPASAPITVNVHNASSATTFEADVDKILSSPFPDIGRLRELIDINGYIPTHQRLPILLLLLTGSCHADEEADRFAVSASEREFHRDLVTDSQSLIKVCYPPHGIAPQISMQYDLIDVVILYCQRRSIDYRNVFCRLLISIFGEGEHQSKSFVSSCFYAIMTNFLPLVGLQYGALDIATDAMHTWLRLLVTYHSPSLAQHLDRVLPGWEKKAKELSTSQSSKISVFQKASSALDSLERELGIDLGFDFDGDITNGAAGESSHTEERSIQSAPPKSAAYNGMIHSHWITTFFAGCVPAAQSASLLDWAIFNGERYGGIYFVASLLEIHASVLEQMNATQLQQFFDSIATNQADWYKPLVSSSPSSASPSAATATTWSDFTEAWIHATTALINNTPQAFRQALSRTETWATVAAERQRRELSSQVQSLKQQSKALLAMDDVENDNFFETSLDEPLHGQAQQSSSNTNKSKTTQKPKGSSTAKLSGGVDMATTISSPFGDHDDDDEDDDLMEDAKPTQYTVSSAIGSSIENDDSDSDDGHTDTLSNSYMHDGDHKSNAQNTHAQEQQGPNEGAVSSVARRASTLLMDNLRSFTAKLSATAAASASGIGSGSLDSLPRGPQHYPPLPPGAASTDEDRFPQDFKLGVDTSCLWTHAAEIIPSICGSQRRQTSTNAENNIDDVQPRDIEQWGYVRATYRLRLTRPVRRRCFFVGQTAAAPSSASSSSSSSSSSSYRTTAETGSGNAPWYFAIDCRSAEEKQLGLFPKAYAVEPDVITDGEELSHLLTVLAPLKNSIHIAIIGAGDAWHRFCYRQRHPRKYARAVQRAPYQEPVDLQRILEEGRNQVHAVAVFLIKRGFRYISVVDGGFVAAVEALNRPDSRYSLQSALVDSDRARLSALLDIHESAVATTTERALPVSQQMSNIQGANTAATAPSSLLMSSSAAALAMSSSFAVQSQQQTHPLSSSSYSSSSSSASVGSSSTSDTAANNNAATLAALGKNVGSLLSTWVSSAASGVGQSATDNTSTATTAAAASASAAPVTASSNHNNVTAATVHETSAQQQSSSGTSSSSSSGAANANASATAGFAGWGSSLMGKGLDTLKKGWGVTANLTASAVASSAAPTTSQPSASTIGATEQDRYVKDPSTSFIIGDHDDDDDDGHSHSHTRRAIADSHAIGITRTDQERAQALALHRLAGLKKGDNLRITRDELPGAILFPCIKMKKMPIVVKKPATESLLDMDFNDNNSGDETTTIVEQEIPVSRYLVITRERFIVLDTSIAQDTDSSGARDAQQQQNASGNKVSGVGSLAMVKSNHHLTELIKMTFKKKDPELVTLFLLSSDGEPKPRQYRVVKYRDFVATLQKNMERFKI